MKLKHLGLFVCFSFPGEILNRDYAGYYTKTGTDWDVVRTAARADLAADPTEGMLVFELQVIINQLNAGHDDQLEAALAWIAAQP